MAESTGPVYEVTHGIDASLAEDFDAWLLRHVDEMLELPGFSKAEIYTADESPDRAVRVTHYYLDSEADLENYLAGAAAAMRQDVVARFGAGVDTQRRVLHDSKAFGSGSQRAEVCLNCGANLGGQYCGACGQRARSRLISIWELVRDAFGDLLEIDSRVWQTLIPLVTRPGKLTRDYLEGRRVRYMPPFRTYLVLSIVFFLVAFFDPRKEFGIFYEPEPVGTTATEVRSAQDDATPDTDAAENVLVSSQADNDDSPDDDSDGLKITIGGDQAEADCDIGDFENSDVPAWLASRVSKERLQAMCDRIVEDEGRAFLDKLIDNVPVALFVLLPLMALVLKLLYPLSKRYYVEHLLFVVHFHAFVFLALILINLFLRLAELVAFPSGLATLTVIGASLYIPVYLYRSMRHVYEQGHWVTIPKYLALATAYLAGFSFIFLFAAVFAAFSV